MKILFATTNKAKVRYYASKLKEEGIDVVTLQDLNIILDVEEDGLNPMENAVIKAKAYAEHSGLPTIALDDGLFLENVPSKIQPGTNVRRINEKRLNDQEMIEYYTRLVNQYGVDGRLNGYFLKGVAFVFQENVIQFQKKMPRCFTNQRSHIVDEGYPLASIQIIPQVNKFKSELTREEEEMTMDIEQGEIFKFMLDSIHSLKQDKQLTM